MGRRRKNDPDAFPRWIDQVDREIRGLTGQGLLDYPGYQLRYNFAQGKSPYAAAAEIVDRWKGGP